MTTANDVIRAELERLTQYNRKLLAELNEARADRGTESDPTAADRPSRYGLFLGRFADDELDVFADGRRLRTRMGTGMRPDQLRRGETVLLDAAGRVVQAAGYSLIGEVWTLSAVLPDGRRAIVESATGERLVVMLSEQLTAGPLRPGAQLIVDGPARYGIDQLPGTELDRLLGPSPAVDLHRVAGLNRQIARLTESVVQPLQQRRPGIEAAHGVLLYGPPGCGKSLLAAAIAHAAAADGDRVLSLRATDVLSKYVGETEHRLRLVFGRVRELAADGSAVVLLIVASVARTDTRWSWVWAP